MSAGSSLPQDAARLHVTGQARYVDDIPTPAGTLSLAFALSERARARVTKMDLSAVRAAPSVVAVLTAEDLPGANDVAPVVHDEPLLATDEVFYLGQPLFLVVATSHLAARKAARLAEVTYEDLPAVLSIDDALAAGSYLNGGQLTWEAGDARAALDSAPHVWEGSVEIGGQEHFYLEGQAALVIPQEGGDMVVHSSTQHPTEIQHKVAEALGVPMHSVRVEVRRMGGGFGGKESQGNALACACAVAAAMTGRPCKMRYDRDDDMVITGKRHDARITYRVAAELDERLIAVDFTQYMRCGWAQDLSHAVCDRAMLHADNGYAIPNLRVESHRLRTHTQSATAFRGFGGPQGMVGIEHVMDRVAAELGLDSLQVRARNFYPSAGGTGRAVHISEGVKPGVTHYGQTVEDCVLPELVAALRDSSDYDTRRAAVADWNAGQPILKKGIALTPVKFGISFTLSHLNQAGALVHVYQDGSVHLNHGGTEMGQGLFQKVAQVAAQSFGLPLEMVKITATDTGKVPNTSATAASSGSDLNGMAVKLACDEIRDRMAAHLAHEHQAMPSEVVFEGGTVSVAGEEMPFAEAARRCYFGRVGLSATGFYKTPGLSWDRLKGQGRPFFYFAYGAAVTEVVIDTLTGENRILRADIVHDVGRSLNPALDIGQIEGGYVQGAGWLTTEELVWDTRGALRTHAPSTYKIPACSDRPDVFNVGLWDGENRAETIYRSKAVGEPPLMLGISALSAAVAACCEGPFQGLDAPATPERILMALREARAA